MKRRIIIYSIALIALIIAMVFYFTRPIETEEEEIVQTEEETEEIIEEIPNIILAEFPTLDKPVFSHPPGFYDEPFNLIITAEEGTTIRFTTDGSIPTLESDIFTDSLLIRSMQESPMSMQGIGRSFDFERDWTNDFTPNMFYNGRVIRAAVFDDNGDFSETVTSTFFLEHNGRFNTRVLSLVMEPDHFIHPTQGMYRNWDRELWPTQPDVHSEDGPRHVVHAEMFSPDGSLMFSQHTNAWVFGNWSRRHPKRSFRLNFSQGDGDIIDMVDLVPNTRKNFYNPLEFVTDFRHLNARVSDYGATGIRDSLVALLSTPLRPTLQNATYGAVFINGEFWGMYELRTHRHSHLLSQMFGIPSGNIQLEDYTEEHIYNAYFKGRDLSQQEEYEELNNYIDMDDFIDYLIIGYHFENWDWINNNFEFWRSTEIFPDIHGGDGRWRFIVQDFDNGINHPENNMMQFFTSREGVGDIPTLHWDFGNSQRRPDWVVDMITNLFNNETFRNTFAARYSTYAATAFHPERTNDILDKMIAERIDTIGFDLYRWRFHGATTPTSAIQNWLGWGHWNWGGTTDCIRYTLDNRAEHAINHILQYFNENLSLGLDTDLANIIFAIPEGWFDISGAELRPDLLDGYNYFNFEANYIKGLPITITAHPISDDYEFMYFKVSTEQDPEGIIFYENPITITPLDDNIILGVFTQR